MKITAKVKVSPAEGDLLKALCQIKNYTDVTVNSRRSAREFDIEYGGTEMGYERPDVHPRGFSFLAWLPLSTIREGLNLATDETYESMCKMSDYPDMARDGDWSAFRDSDTHAIWRIFEIARTLVMGDYDEFSKELKNKVTEGRAKKIIDEMANHGKWTGDWGLTFDTSADANRFWDELERFWGPYARKEHARIYSSNRISAATRQDQRHFTELARQLGIEAEPDIDEPGERRHRHGLRREREADYRHFTVELGQKAKGLIGEMKIEPIRTTVTGTSMTMDDVAVGLRRAGFNAEFVSVVNTPKFQVWTDAPYKQTLAIVASCNLAVVNVINFHEIGTRHNEVMVFRGGSTLKFVDGELMAPDKIAKVQAEWDDMASELKNKTSDNP